MSSREDMLVEWILASRIVIEIYHVSNRSYEQLLQPEPDDVRRTKVASNDIVGVGSLQMPFQYVKRKTPGKLYTCVVYLWAMCRPRRSSQEFYAILPTDDHACIILTRKGVRAMNGTHTRLVA